MLLFFPSTAFVATRALPPRRVQPRRVQPLLLEEPEVPPIVDPIIDGTHSERDNGEPSTVTTESGERSDRHGAKEIVKGALQAVKEDTKSAAKVVKEKLAALTGTGTAALSGASPSSSPVAAAPAADSAAGEEDDLTKEREDAVGDRLNKLSDAPISTETYLNSLSRFADDGRRLLNAPQRYSSKDWFANLRSMPRCQLLRAVRGQLGAVWQLFVVHLDAHSPGLCRAGPATARPMASRVCSALGAPLQPCEEPQEARQQATWGSWPVRVKLEARLCGLPSGTVCNTGCAPARRPASRRA